MAMTKNRHKHPDLYRDLEKIKAAIAEATRDATGLTGEALSHSFESARDKSIEMKDKMADYTASKPFKSLSVTFLLGIVVGYLLHK